VKNEFEKIIEALKLINKRFQNGIVMIWYPIKAPKEINKFYNDLKNTGYKEFLKIEFSIESEILGGMTKCGLIIANPPYIHEEIKLMMHFLSEKIYNGKANYIIEVI
jgi:23S rRNA (adenine2030-N6)-methyltransferase